MMRSRAFAIAAALAMTMTDANAQATDPVLLHAAGSLRAALTDISKAFEVAGGAPVQAKYGPSGLLKDEIAGGGKAEVFASANMEHPQALAATGRSGPVVLFARNRLCALISTWARGRACDAARTDARSWHQARDLDAAGGSVRRLCLRGVSQSGCCEIGRPRNWRARRCSSPAGRRVPRRRPAAALTVGTSPKAVPTFFLPIARRHARPRRNIPVSRSWRCQTRLRSVRTMGLR